MGRMRAVLGEIVEMPLGTVEQVYTALRRLEVAGFGWHPEEPASAIVRFGAAGEPLFTPDEARVMDAWMSAVWTVGIALDVDVCGLSLAAMHGDKPHVCTVCGAILWYSPSSGRWESVDWEQGDCSHTVDRGCGHDCLLDV